MIKSDKSIAGPMSVMSSSLIASIPNWYLAKYFTYHFLLSSWFGRHSLAPENSTVTCFHFRKTSLRFLWKLFPSLGRLMLFLSYDRASMVLCPIEKKASAPVSLLVVGANSASPSWVKSIGALSPESKWADQPKIWKQNILESSLRNPLRSWFLLAWEKWHSPSSPIRITSYPFPKWISWNMAYKLILHGVSEGSQRKHPYVVGLRSSLEAR